MCVCVCAHIREHMCVCDYFSPGGCREAGDPPRPGGGGPGRVLPQQGEGAVGLRTHRCLPGAPAAGQGILIPHTTTHTHTSNDIIAP